KNTPYADKYDLKDDYLLFDEFKQCDEDLSRIYLEKETNIEKLEYEMEVIEKKLFRKPIFYIVMSIIGIMVIVGLVLVFLPYEEFVKLDAYVSSHWWWMNFIGRILMFSPTFIVLTIFFFLINPLVLCQWNMLKTEIKCKKQFNKIINSLLFYSK
ncbi:MAG: hypothetical protein IJW21_01095, partial [Clostridia bacterium]|nr:hypothetical protein [Clostridia bacterium]